MGPREKALNNYLQSINVVREIYHGRVLLGNQCVKVLHNHKNICDFMQGSGMQEKITHLFKIFSEIQPLLYSNRFLTEEGVVLFCRLCGDFGTYYPNESIFRKVHELVITVPRFKLHRIFGL